MYISIRSIFENKAFIFDGGNMPEEFGLGIDTGGEGGESGGEQVSEEAQQRARDDAARAKQVRAQIQQAHHQNTQFALMLSLLLQHIDNDTVLGLVFKQLIDYKVPTPAIFGQFLPCIRKKTDIGVYKNMYGELWTRLPKELNVTTLVTWLKEVRQASQALQNIPLEDYLSFTLEYLQRQKAIDMSTLDEQKQGELKESVRKVLEA